VAPREGLQAAVEVDAAEIVQVPDDGERRRRRWQRTDAVLAAWPEASNDVGEARNHEEEAEDD
jgi:hypothetical protein